MSKGLFDVLKEDLPDAVRCLAHRGPDDEGVQYIEGQGVGLGHRRLSILDLSSAGHQPMESDDGGTLIVFNGEVFNFLEVGNDLEALGHVFRSSSDTEVVLKAYQQWGSKCLDRFVGMFAIAIWEKNKERLFLARDRLGIKPLYYYHCSDMFVFASELKALMAFKDFPRDIDAEALPLFLHYQYIPAPGTVFRNTCKLLPGHYLLLEKKQLRIKRFWQCPRIMEPADGRRLTDEAAVDLLEGIVTRAVGDRLISDVPLGALLSGGIDSSLVVAVMQKLSRRPVKTFTIGFSEDSFNEAPFAARIARRLMTDHTELFVTPREALEVIPRLPEIYDEPFADSSAIPTYLVSRLTREHVTVALSGDGGDEQFAGYVRHWMTRSLRSFLGQVHPSSRERLGRLMRLLPPRLLGRCYSPMRKRLPQRMQVANFNDKWQKLLAALGESSLAEVYRMTVCLWSSDELFDLTGSTLPTSRYESLFEEAADMPVISQLLYVDQQTYLPDCMLTKVDRASMANGLEIRVPLLDHRVIEFTAQLPESLKYRNGKGKYLLKKLLSRFLPLELFERPKMGFGIPLEQWLRKELKELMLDYLSPGRLKNNGTFNPVFVDQCITEHLKGTSNHHHRLWAILMWEMWRERWLEGMGNQVGK